MFKSFLLENLQLARIFLNYYLEKKIPLIQVDCPINSRE